MGETDASSALFERLRKVLAPDHTLEREIARGGMGIVYLARNMALDRLVAIKLLKPELATAEMATRFLREAHLLAQLSHPNIVPVYGVGNEDGLYFYIMEYLGEETLQSRLARGPMTTAETLDLGIGLLGAVRAAHKHHLIHRDIKPGNIFLTEDRAVLTDFGIAKPLDQTSLTGTAQLIGTYLYMSPEQREAQPATERSDIYAAGIVLYEAHTGRRWWSRNLEVPADWSGVPFKLTRILKKALNHDPADRWPDAASFRRDLIRIDRGRWITPTMLLGVVIAVALVLGMNLLPVCRILPWLPWCPVASNSLEVRLQTLDYRGPESERWVGDSLGRAVVTRLAAYPDLTVSGPFPAGAPELREAAIVLTGTVETSGEGIQATVRSTGFRPCINARNSESPANWQTLADSITAKLLFDFYVCGTPLDSSLPIAALPKSLAGRKAWTRAERLFSQARWGEADSAYRAVEAMDPTCFICAFRINDIDRWLDHPHDPERLAQLQAHADSFPDHYRLLIQATVTPWPERLFLIDSATKVQNFFLAWFHKGDELFHRGPLDGHARSEAILAFEQSVHLRPDFAPAWEHLAWVYTAEGDSAKAARALERLDRAGPPADATSLGARLLLQTGFAFRFLPAGYGGTVVKEGLKDPRVAGYRDLAMAPRLMLTFDAPGGAVVMGQIFAGMPELALVRSGLLAQVYGHLAQGNPDSSLLYARILRERVPGTDRDVFAAQLAATLLLVEADSAELFGDKATRAREELRRYSLPGAASEDAKRRAAWLLVLLARRAAVRDQAEAAQGILGEDGMSQYYGALLEADSLASHGDYAQALSLTTWRGDDLARLPDPFFSTIVHFFRSSWYENQGNPAAAIKTLQWHEAYDFGTYPTGEPQPPESDLAFGTLARWRQARLLDPPGNPAPNVCRAYQAVVRLWQHGNPLSRTRANLAAERLRMLSCTLS